MYALGFRIIFRPDSFELIQVVWPQNGPITSQIIKVVHDDGYKKVDNLKQEHVNVLLLGLKVFQVEFCD